MAARVAVRRIPARNGTALVGRGGSGAVPLAFPNLFRKEVRSMRHSNSCKRQARRVRAMAARIAGVAVVLLFLAPLDLHAQAFCIDGPCGLNLVGQSASGEPDADAKLEPAD